MFFGQSVFLCLFVGGVFGFFVVLFFVCLYLLYLNFYVFFFFFLFCLVACPSLFFFFFPRCWKGIRGAPRPGLFGIVNLFFGGCGNHMLYQMPPPPPPARLICPKIYHQLSKVSPSWHSGLCILVKVTSHTLPLFTIPPSLPFCLHMAKGTC